MLKFFFFCFFSFFIESKLNYFYDNDLNLSFKKKVLILRKNEEKTIEFLKTIKNKNCDFAFFFRKDDFIYILFEGGNLVCFDLNFNIIFEKSLGKFFIDMFFIDGLFYFIDKDKIFYCYDENFELRFYKEFAIYSGYFSDYKFEIKDCVFFLDKSLKTFYLIDKRSFEVVQFLFNVDDFFVTKEFSKEDTKDIIIVKKDGSLFFFDPLNEKLKKFEVQGLQFEDNKLFFNNIVFNNFIVFKDFVIAVNENLILTYNITCKSFKITKSKVKNAEIFVENDCVYIKSMERIQKIEL